jgi:tricorn protease-like protein
VFVVGGGSGTADQIVVYQMDSQGTGFAPKDPQPATVGQVATDLKYSADGQKLYRVGNGPNLYIYNTADMTAEQTIDTGFSALQEVKVSKDGKVIATVNAQKTVSI